MTVVHHFGTAWWSLLQESNIQLSIGIWPIEGKIKGGIEVTGRRGRRRKKLLDDRKERRGYSHLKEEALDRTMWIAGFGRGFGLVVRQTAI